MAAAHSLIGETNALLSKPNHMKPSLIEAGARLFVTRFLGTYISAGCLILLEEGDTILTFEGDKRKCSMKIVLKVHTPQFYWKIMTRADLGLADAYIDGDISFTDENEGLIDLFLILIAGRESKSSILKLNQRRDVFQLPDFAGSLDNHIIINYPLFSLNFNLFIYLLL
ncbi:uncharacterized protein LOC112038565 isoform X1 [Quercus suber]|uniref:uncharacterized protein LOC112038565 isoform X1 n=1 Tax=Quercus suber TaxID=58331 RepID=UPI0032DFD1A6